MIQTGDNHVWRAVLSKASSYKEPEEGGTQDPDGGGYEGSFDVDLVETSDPYRFPINREAKSTTSISV